MRFLKSRHALVLTVVLLLQAGAFYTVAARPEIIPIIAPLSTFPASLGPWQMILDQPIEPEVLDVLKADDTLNRAYQKLPEPTAAFLFIAFFKTQRTGQAPHSPKNCLPGAGWAPIQNGTQTIQIPGRDTPITVNRYIVAHASDQSAVFYWYQSHGRVVAREALAKMWLVADAIRYHRSDTALVKVTVPVQNGQTDKAIATGIQFVQAIFPTVSERLDTGGM